MAAELRQLIEEEQTLVRQRDFARRRHLAAADQSHIGAGVVRGATRAGRHHRRGVARQAGHAVEACGLKRFGQRHRRQECGQPPRQPHGQDPILSG
jgi:hypothetical protein